MTTSIKEHFDMDDVIYLKKNPNYFNHNLTLEEPIELGSGEVKILLKEGDDQVCYKIDVIDGSVTPHEGTGKFGIGGNLRPLVETLLSIEHYKQKRKQIPEGIVSNDKKVIRWLNKKVDSLAHKAPKMASSPIQRQTSYAINMGDEDGSVVFYDTTAKPDGPEKVRSLEWKRKKEEARLKRQEQANRNMEVYETNAKKANESLVRAKQQIKIIQNIKDLNGSTVSFETTNFKELLDTLGGKKMNGVPVKKISVGSVELTAKEDRIIKKKELV